MTDNKLNHFITVSSLESKFYNSTILMAFGNSYDTLFGGLKGQQSTDIHTTMPHVHVHLHVHLVCSR